MHWTNRIAIWTGETPCEAAVEWAKGYPTLKEAWDACPRADWMLWLVTRVDINLERHRMIVRAVCEMVRHQLCHVPEGELRPLRAIEAAEAWVAKPTEANAKKAKRAADAAHLVIEEAYAVIEDTGVAEVMIDVAEAATCAALSAETADTAEAAEAAIDAAEAAAWAAVKTAERTSRAAAWDAERKAQADILRQHLSCPEVS